MLIVPRAALVGLILVTGCAPAGSVHLIQPQLQEFQRVLRLTTDQACWAQEQGVLRVLAEFPLPGARQGETMYLLYLRVPADVKDVPMNGTSAKGFFIQIRGEHAGLALVTGGTLKIAGTGRGRGAARRLELSLVLEDDSRITGKIAATKDDYLVQRFETHRRPADVKALVSPQR